MTEHDKADWVHLQGRIIVLELVIRTMLTGKMLDQRIRWRPLNKYKAALWGSLEPMAQGFVVSEPLSSEID
jgi:hypothetical protein